MALARRLGCTLLLTLAIGREAPAAAQAGSSAVADAVERRDRDGLQRLLASRADVNAPQGDGATALHWAVYWDDGVMVEALLKAGASVDRGNDLQVTPLRLACGNAAVAGTLMSRGANPDAALASGETVLMTCARTGTVATVNALLDAGAAVNATTLDSGQTALMWAAAEGRGDLVAALLAHGADANAESATGFTPLLFAARSGSLAAAQALLDAGADLDVRAADGSTPVLVAALSVEALVVRDYRFDVAASGHEDVALLLIERGADGSRGDRLGMTPLHAAVEMEKPRLLDALIAGGIDLNPRLNQGLPFRRGDVISRAGYAGATPYWMAAKKADLKSMRQLAQAGADTNLASRSGTTPLLVASGLGQTDSRMPPEAAMLEAVRVAIELGGDLLARSGNGQNAVHGAANVSANSIIRFLAAQGVDVNAADNRGQTPLDVTRQQMRPRPDTGALLRELGARDPAPTQNRH